MKKSNSLFSFLTIVLPVLAIGVWMLLSPQGEAHQEIEDAGVYFVKSIWGKPAGLTILVFGIFLAVVLIITSRRGQQGGLSPGRLSFRISFWIFTCTAVIYAIILVQNFLVETGMLGKDFYFTAMDDIALVIYTFLVVFGITAGILWLVLKK
ncbi:MAG TPA: hypothetical protein VFU15_17820 [Bacteroidia bacterium]|nr:hypothetical protein [Bacteroidia bacterium]